MEEQKKKKKTWLVVLCCILAVVLIGVAAAFLWLDAIVGKIGSLEPAQTLSSSELDELFDPTDALGGVNVPTVPATIITPSENVINILLVGQDRRPDQPRLHSDATILCTINKTKKTVTMTSFMRDMWVKIPGYGEQRINTTYMIDGFDLLNKTLEHNFGVSGDYNVEVDFSGFMTAVDAVGGIDVELTKKEAEYLNRRGNWDVENNAGEWELVQGVNHLTGSQALAYSRIREIGSDFARTARQRKVLTILIEKAKTLPLKDLYALVDALLPMISTDMTKGEILGLALELAPMLSEFEVISQRIPMDGQYSTAIIKGNDVLVLSESNYKKARKLLADTMMDE